MTDDPLTPAEPVVMPEEGELAVAPEPLAAPLPDAEPLAETAAEIESLDVDAPRVGIIVSDDDDLPTLGRAEQELERREIRSEVRVLSAAEDAEAVAAYTENARARGIRVLIAGAGPRARLPAAVTVHTRLPVIGVPLSSRGVEPGALDPLLADRPDDRDEPIAWVGLDDALGAAVLAARILGA